MSALPHKHWTVEEYLEFERNSDERHEFVNGEVFAMSGASRNHGRITRNTLNSLTNQLIDKACEPFPESVRIKINKKDYTYPDVSVVCGEQKLDDEAYLDSIVNQTLIVEVLSPSTAMYDRTTKFQKYKQITSLQEYVLIEQDKPYIERYLRQSDGQWLYRDASRLDTSLELPSIGCTLALADVYRQVTFDEGELHNE